MEPSIRQYFSLGIHIKKLERGDTKIQGFGATGFQDFFNHSMQLHFIHHLHPGIGHFDEPKAIEALKPFMIARKVPGAEKIPDQVTYNPLINVT